MAPTAEQPVSTSRPAATEDDGTALRSLADALRQYSPDYLGELLCARPDVLVPVPTDLSTVAARLGSRSSIRRAVDQLNATHLQIMETLAVAPDPAPAAQVSKLWGADASDGLEYLRQIGLAWGPPEALRLVQSAREALGPYPAGLGPDLVTALTRRTPGRVAELAQDLGVPVASTTEATAAAIADRLGNPATVSRLLQEAPAGATDLLERLTWGPPIGKLTDADRPVRVGQTTTAVEWLLAHGLLAVADSGHVVLPREVAIALRGGRIHRQPQVGAPELETVSRTARLASDSALAAIGDLLRWVEHLGGLWESESPAILRGGGLGIRDHRRTASRLGVPEDTAAFVIELAYCAGLISDDGQADPAWAPTPVFDEWLAGDPAQKWCTLASEWLSGARVWQLAAPENGREASHLLSAALERPSIAALREQVLLLMAVKDQATTPESLSDYLAWHRPRQAPGVRQELVDAVLTDARLLGLTGAGVLSKPAALLLNGELAAAEHTLRAALPAPVTEILVQADLTAMVPGPPAPDLARELALTTEVESRGAATVVRFSEASLRKALDAGWSGDDILAMVTRRSRTPVPQALEYLVTDTARRFGRVRVGAAGAYLRAEDPSVITEVLHDPRAATLRLRRLAPTVLVAPGDPGTLIETLRELNVAAVGETIEGDVVLSRPVKRRSAMRAPRPVRHRGPEPDHVRALVAVLRSSGSPLPRPAESGAPPATPISPSSLVTALRTATRDRSGVWISLVDSSGTAVRRLVEPISVEAGQLVAMDRSAGAMRSFPLHRIRSADVVPKA